MIQAPAPVVDCPVCREKSFGERFTVDFDVVRETKTELFPMLHLRPCGRYCRGSLPFVSFWEDDEVEGKRRYSFRPGLEARDYCRHLPHQFCDERAT